MPANEPSPTPARIPSLDGWRALAILLVLGDHWLYTKDFPSSWHGLGAVFHGDLGVRIFFVLSGFLITLLMIREREQTGAVHLGRFFLRRACRILPVYFVYLGVLALLAAIGLYRDASGSWFGALTFTRNFFGHGDSATAHLWSLAVEEQFYLVWPTLFTLLGLRLGGRSLLVGILLGLILVCPFLRAIPPAEIPGAHMAGRLLGPRSILLYADSLAIGCLGAWFASRKAGLFAWRKSYTSLAWLGLGLVIAGRCLQQNGRIDLSPLVSALIPTVQAWAIIASLWLSTHPAYPLFRILNHRVVVGLGLVSYSLYIWHFLFVSHFIGPPLAEWITHDWRIWWLPSLALACLSYHCLEKPLVRWRKQPRALAPLPTTVASAS